MILVTGGAGFIGANFLNSLPHSVRRVCFDKLTYAGNVESIERVQEQGDGVLVVGDVADGAAVGLLLAHRRPRSIVHFAAESHVDRSIRGPDEFVSTNVVGTYRLLQETLRYWREVLSEDPSFRFLHISTDEVYGSLGPTDPPFTESTPYAPNSPYSASKAASDHLVRAWHHTYGLPTLTTNCSNNYGPYQFPEKLIPLMIHNALAGKPLPIYGDGQNVRDWLYVGDHCDAIRLVLENGRPGETYNIGGRCEMKNIDVVHTVCDVLDELSPRTGGGSYRDQIAFVKDRPGHDRRYAVDCSKIERELGWRPKETFASGIRKTVQWYLDNQTWVQHVVSGEYRNWVDKQYGGGAPA